MAIKITLFLPLDGDAHIVKEQFCLQDNAVYWYLYPYFLNLFTRTGEMINLYRTSRFAGDTLLQLDNALSDIIKSVAEQPNEWSQKIDLLKPGKKDLYDTITKTEVLDVLKSLKNITTNAIKSNAVVMFEGL